ncbi:MAG: DoxX family membrane protein [Cyanobacteria bacterium]|nr:DoxX family membrane protein [Cyanobacteriota bacterium]
MHSFLQPLVRVGLGVIFLSSGWEKLNQLDAFYKAAQNYKILPPEITHFYSVMVPWLEIGLGAYLILGLFLRVTSWLSAALYLSFVIAIAMVLMRGDAIDCGCFIAGRVEPLSWDLFFRDVGLLLATVYVGFFPQHGLSVDACLQNPSTVSEK